MYIVFKDSLPHSEQPPCPECGMTLSVLSKTGRLGCPVCYTHFAGRISGYLRRIHGPAVHNGKIPQSAGTLLQSKRRAAQLREELEKAIEAQEFERCAQLRDALKALSEGEAER